MNEIVDLSRLQFAITAMYHILFVPLTLGMTGLLVIMESLYVITDNPLYKDMTKFWGKLFGINFALGVTTGITLEFQFGTNWAYYSHYVGDIFGAPLAIEGIWADKYDQLAAFQNFIIMPATMLSGVFYSIHSLPPAWQAVSHFNPFFYMIDGFRYGFFGVSDIPPWNSLAIVTFFFVVVSVIALRLLQNIGLRN